VFRGSGHDNPHDESVGPARIASLPGVADIAAAVDWLRFLYPRRGDRQLPP
jgi:hypothetical protein